MLNFDLNQLFKVGSDGSDMLVAFFSSGVFRFLPAFGDSSEALLLLVTPLEHFFFW